MIVWKKNELGFEHAEITGVSFDSRTLQAGDLFFALSGPNYNGHLFVQQALDKGAACVLIDEFSYLTRDARVVLVDSVFLMLKTIGLRRRSEIRATVIAVTGSVGKTTARKMLCHAIRANSGGLHSNKVFEPIKNFNNILGVLHTLAQTPVDTQFLIMEIGTSLPGEIDELARIIMPHYSLITHVGGAHLQYFGTLSNIASEKGNVIKHTQNKVFFNEDFWYCSILEKIACANGVHFEFFNGLGVASVRDGVKKILQELNLDFNALDSFEHQIEGRRNMFAISLNYSNVRVIDSVYNANFSSMIEEIRNLQKYSGKKIAILSDMVEIGAHAQKFHANLAKYINSEVLLLLIGENMKYLHAKVKRSIWFLTLQELDVYVMTNVRYDCVILLKGSVNFLKEFKEKLQKLESV